MYFDQFTHRQILHTSGFNSCKIGIPFDVKTGPNDMQTIINGIKNECKLVVHNSIFQPTKIVEYKQNPNPSSSTGTVSSSSINTSSSSNTSEFQIWFSSNDHVFFDTECANIKIILPPSFVFINYFMAPSDALYYAGNYEYYTVVNESVLVLYSGNYAFCIDCFQFNPHEYVRSQRSQKLSSPSNIIQVHSCHPVVMELSNAVCKPLVDFSKFFKTEEESKTIMVPFKHRYGGFCHSKTWILPVNFLDIQGVSFPVLQAFKPGLRPVQITLWSFDSKTGYMESCLDGMHPNVSVVALLFFHSGLQLQFVNLQIKIESKPDTLVWWDVSDKSSSMIKTLRQIEMSPKTENDDLKNLSCLEIYYTF